MSTHRSVIINVVGLTPRLIGPNTPRIQQAVHEGGMIRVKPIVPAVTCTAQSTVFLCSTSTACPRAVWRYTPS